MSDPVILFGISAIDQKPVAFGLFASTADAQRYVQTERLPANCYWSVFTPALGTVSVCRTHAHDADLQLKMMVAEASALHASSS